MFTSTKSMVCFRGEKVLVILTSLLIFWGFVWSYDENMLTLQT